MDIVEKQVISAKIIIETKQGHKMEQNKEKELPIGFMDSGLGGISVLKAAVQIMPNEDFIYFGDSKNAPYGVKDRERIRELTFHVVKKLMKQGIKGLAVACNTATSAAVKDLRLMYPDLPLVGIEPAIKPAVSQYKGGEILVLATPMTIRQEKFHNLLGLYKEQAHIIPVPCAGLMEFVEEGHLDGEFLDAYFSKYLLPYITDKTETIVLGCTHYPFLRPHLREFLGNRRIEIIDGSMGTAKELKRRLGEKNLLHAEKREQKIIFENSMEKQEMIDLSWQLLRLPID